MCERKCPNQSDQTLNGLDPASSLVQSPCNVRLRPCVNTAVNSPENSQRASGLQLLAAVSATRALREAV